MPVRVLVVCTANICRSPATAALLQRELGDLPYVEVESAGVAAMTGAAACDLSSALAGDLAARSTVGAAFEGRSAVHASRLVTAQLASDADLVLALDRSHRSALARLAPASRTRTFTLRQAARLSDLVADTVRSGALPAGAPPLPAEPEDRVRWFVAELDAARGSAPPGHDPDQHHQWHDDDVPDPHVLGYQLHAVAMDLIGDATTRLAAGLRLVLAVDEPLPAGPEPAGSDRLGGLGPG